MNHELVRRDLTDRLEALVDGELDGVELRNLVADLDDEPEGWRRCALSFLEAQALQSELRAWRSEAAQDGPRLSVDSPRLSAQPSSPRPPLMRYGLLSVAMAASFLLAFSLGIIWNPPVRHGEQGFARSPVEQAPDGRAEAGASVRDALAEGNAEEGGRVTRPVGSVTLVMERGSNAEELDLPVYSLRDVGTRSLEPPAPIPPDVQGALERLGFQVHGELGWSPVELGGQRQLLVPLGRVRIIPVTMPAAY